MSSSKHLINGIKVPTSLESARKQLQEAHDHLARRARLSLEQGLKDIKEDGRQFGIRMKGHTVDLSSGPGLVGKDEEKLSEVITMCATVERLLDALEWASRELATWEVESAQPTTSSDDPTDLVLRCGGRRACLEVTDAIDPKNNKKLNKSLSCLKIGRNGPSGNAQKFLIVPNADEWRAKVIDNQTKRKRAAWYGEPVFEGDTLIVRLKPPKPKHERTPS